MSFADDLFVDDEGRAEADQAAEIGSRFVDMTDRPFGAQVVCAAAIGADVILMAVTLFGARLVAIFPNPLIIYGLELVASFPIGFFILFAAYKIYKNEVASDNDIHIDGGLMSGFADEENSRRKLAGYYFGAAGAIINTAIWLGLAITRG